MLRRERRKDKLVGDTDAELIAVAPSGGVTREARRESCGAIERDPRPSHPAVHEATVGVPDDVDPRPRLDAAGFGHF